MSDVGFQLLVESEGEVELIQRLPVHLHFSGAWRTVPYQRLSLSRSSSITISSIYSPQGLSRNPWHPMRRRSSSRSSRSFKLLGTPGTIALRAIALAFTILAVRGPVTLKTLSALKPGSHNQSHFARKSFELKLLLSPLFHSLSAKQLESTTTGKQKANVEEEG